MHMAFMAQIIGLKTSIAIKDHVDYFKYTLYNVTISNR